MSTSKKSFAQKYSNEFEKVILDMVEVALQKDFEIIASSNTKEKSDGGYDGYCYIKSPYDETSTALLEAKLRTAMKDLPLSDFSKSVIIAINLDAACIIIGTNLYFSGKTVEQLQAFIYNTGLEIRTLDYNDIAYWMQRNPNKIQSYKKPFITALKKYVSKEHTTACKELSLYNNTYIPTNKVYPINIYGNDRKSINIQIVKKISETFRIHIIYGEEGIGKKTLMESIINEVVYNQTDENNFRFIANKVDMGSVTSNNDFIYKIISLLWGCDYKDTVDFFCGIGNSESNNSLNKFLPKNIINYLLKLSNIYNNINIDVFFSYIADLYAKSIQRKKVKRIFCFYNLEYSENAEVNKLVITFLRKMSNYLSIILCVPSNNELKEQRPEWASFCDVLFETKNITVYPVNEWSSDIANVFVKDNIDDLEISKYSNYIVKYFGKNPAYLSAGIELIRSDKMILSYITSDNIALDESFDLNKLKSAINYNIGKISHRQQELVFLMLTIGTEVNNKFICEVININVSELRNLIDNLPYFELKENLCCWKNQLNLKLIKEIDYSVLSFKQKEEIYNKIIKYISLLDIEDNKDEVCFSIYLNLCNKAKVYSISKKLIEKYRNEEKYSKIYKITTKLIDSEICEEDNKYNIYLRIEWLYAAFKIGRNGQNTDFWDKFIILEEKVENYLKKYDKTNDEINLMMGKYFYIASLIYLSNSEYKKMQNEIKKGIDCLKGLRSKESLILQSEFCANYAVSLKHLENIENCVKYLENNEVIQRNSEIAQMPKYIISYHSHHASLFTGCDPQKALEEFIEIDEICKKYTKEAYLHNLHNISSMKFILKDYNGALADAQTVYRESYENNVSIEFGRCQNVLGCLMWQKNKVKKAKYYFECCYKHFKKHSHNTHLWAPLVNLAVLCMDTNDADTYKYAKLAADFLVSKHIAQIKSAIVYENNIPKIIVAVLMLIYIFDSVKPDSKDIEVLIASIDNDTIIQLYNNQVKGKPLNELFVGSAYNCEGKIMLKV